MMKKWLFVAFCALMLFSIAACSSAPKTDVEDEIGTVDYTDARCLQEALRGREIMVVHTKDASSAIGSCSKVVQLPFALGSEAVHRSSKVVQYLIAVEKETTANSFT